MPVEMRGLDADALRRRWAPEEFSFESTADLPELSAVIGQERAVHAVAVGIDIASPGHHVFALGAPGTGKTTTIVKFLRNRAADMPVPDDWCYVPDLERPDQPKALRLPAGKGCEFRRDMDALLEEFAAELPRAFESEAYEREQESIQEQFDSQRQSIFQTLEEEARNRGFGLVQTPHGMMVAPVVNGSIISPEQLEQLDESSRQDIEGRRTQLQDQVRESARRVQQAQREARERVRELDRQVVGYAVAHHIDDLKARYADIPGAVEYLDAIQRDIVDKAESLKQARQLEQMQQQNPMAMMAGRERLTFEQYAVNLLVDNCDTQGAPVIVERNPNFHNLLGRLEYDAQFGALVTDHRMIKAGALHRANGGYLVVSARDVLTEPFTWDGLKHALKNREIRVETMGASYRAIQTRSLEAQPIPLDVKVILIGDPYIYSLLYNLDPEFRELFKIKADFGVDVDWSAETAEQYARFIGTVCREENLRHFSPGAVARVLEHSARLAGDQGKLATRFGEVVDLVRQASYWAGEAGHDLVQREDVERTIEDMIYRSNRIEERLREMITDGTILIDTTGEVVGQVNGISVLAAGDYAFGKPSRITARTHVGSSGVVSIDRETELGGRLHNKGALILAGYLGGKYASDEPLAFSATLAFEQLYEEVEGDSASSAELYALLSSLSGLPIRQGLAVTGSVNQRGQVQAIGGVNEKIEGFYAVCEAQGLTGEQGVVIPQANVRHLMLRDKVIDAVREGRFNIYPVSTVDEGIALLTGVEAGEADAEGQYPEGTVNQRVQERLRAMAGKVKEFSRGAAPEPEKALAAGAGGLDGDEVVGKD